MNGNILRENYKIDLILKSINLEHLIHNFSKKGVTMDTFFNLTEEDLDYLDILDEKERDIILKEIQPYQHMYKDIVEQPELNCGIMLKHCQKHLKMIGSLLVFLSNNLILSNENPLIDDSHSVATAIGEFARMSVRQLELAEMDIQSAIGKKTGQRDRKNTRVFATCIAVSFPFFGYLLWKQLQHLR